MSIEKKDEFINKGYWSIAAQKHFVNFKINSSNFNEFDSLNTAGKAGRLMGAIRGSVYIDNMKKLEAMAQQVGINRKELTCIVLPYIDKSAEGQVEIKRNTAGDIIGIEEYIFDNNSALELAGKVFEKLEPRNIERIAVKSLDKTKKLPYLKEEITQALVNDFKEEEVQLALTLQEQFKLLQKLQTGSKIIYSNEYIWGKNHDKIAYAISHIEFDERQTLSEVVNYLQNRQGTAIDDIPKIDNELLILSKKIGMVNPTKIITTRNFDKEFLFSSNLISNNLYSDDILDDVKLFIASIRFGERFTQYSTLRTTASFIKALIDRDRVGPHSANGTDYTLLEQRGIIKVERSNLYPNRFYMKLLRKDVAEEALKILSSDEYVLNDTFNENESLSLLEAGKFMSPEEIRLQYAESTGNIKDAEAYLMSVLRDEEI